MFCLPLLVLLLTAVNGKVLIVDNHSRGTRIGDGSLDRPFTTIQDCVNALKKGKPGDECQLRSGRYHEEVKIDSLHGTQTAPFIIRGYQDEVPVIDGTVIIKPVTSWKPMKSGSRIYKAQISQDVWQLFLDGNMMTNARWPNSKWSDRTIFNGSYWAHVADSSKRGLLVNRDNSLADTNIDMNGAMAVMNIGSFNTFVAKVTNHRAGKNKFSFKDTFGDYSFNREHSIYFLEDKLELLDTAEEWFYDKSDKILYLWTPEGVSPAEYKEIRGKVQTYAFQVTDSSHIVLKNLKFFATTLKATSSKYKEVDGLRFDSLQFEYSSYSKRMLQDISLIEKMYVDGYARKAGYGSFVFYNNTFYGTDGFVAFVNGFNVTWENNRFSYNDWTGANMIETSGGTGIIVTKSKHDNYIRNTLYYNGASAGLQPGSNPVVHLNQLIGQCTGVIQHDGAGLQTKTNSQPNAVISYNWAHSSPKYGLRFDGQPPRVGYNGTMDHNVVMLTNGLMVKGDNHAVKNNLAFLKFNNDDDDKQGNGCSLCVLRYVRRNPVAINTNSVVIGNLADKANGGKTYNKKGKGPKFWPVAGKIVENNLFDADIRKLLMDPENFDFRPVKGSVVAKQNIGPYKYEEKTTHYWIPGAQSYKALFPVPPDGSTSVRAPRRDALMWLQALGCNEHAVYFGTNRKRVSDADESSHEYMGTVSEGGNVFYLSERLYDQATYFWRVDAKMGSGETYKGDVWTFTTKEHGPQNY